MRKLVGKTSRKLLMSLRSVSSFDAVLHLMSINVGVVPLFYTPFIPLVVTSLGKPPRYTLYTLSNAQSQFVSNYIVNKAQTGVLAFQKRTLK
jgi:hypothetical protein